MLSRTSLPMSSRSLHFTKTRTSFKCPAGPCTSQRPEPAIYTRPFVNCTQLVHPMYYAVRIFSLLLFVNLDTKGKVLDEGEGGILERQAGSKKQRKTKREKHYRIKSHRVYHFPYSVSQSCESLLYANLGQTYSCSHVLLCSE